MTITKKEKSVLGRPTVFEKRKQLSFRADSTLLKKFYSKAKKLNLTIQQAMEKAVKNFADG